MVKVSGTLVAFTDLVRVKGFPCGPTGRPRERDRDCRVGGLGTMAMQPGWPTRRRRAPATVGPTGGAAGRLPSGPSPVGRRPRRPSPLPPTHSPPWRPSGWLSLARSPEIWCFSDHTKARAQALSSDPEQPVYKAICQPRAGEGRRPRLAELGASSVTQLSKDIMIFTRCNRS
jgi:hypothetical protein